MVRFNKKPHKNFHFHAHEWGKARISRSFKPKNTHIHIHTVCLILNQGELAEKLHAVKNWKKPSCNKHT